MSTSAVTPVAIDPDPVAIAVEVSDTMLKLVLSDGRELAAPLAWFPRLRDASTEQRQHWQPIGRGHGIHWPDLDEDISVRALMGRPELRCAMDDATPHRSDPQVDDLDQCEPEDPREAARLDAEAESDEATGELLPHERMGQWLLASIARGVEAASAQNDAESTDRPNARPARPLATYGDLVFGL